MIYVTLSSDVIQLSASSSAKNLRSLREFEIRDDKLARIWQPIVEQIKLGIAQMDCDCGCIPPDERMSLPLGDWKENGEGLLVRDTDGLAKCFNGQYYAIRPT